MEKAILKTLIYADIFDYPLKINELQKWLIGKKATLRQIEKGLKNLYQVSSIKHQGKYYFLPRRDKLVKQRYYKEKQSTKYFQKAQMLTSIFKIIPWIKLVGVSGGLAVNNVSKKDDIDLFIITSKKRLWICRFLVLGILSLVGQRRKRQDQGRKIAGKICTNIFLEEDKLRQDKKDIFTAHEVLQMKVLWQREGIYSKYLEDNSWVFKYLPNWVGSGAARWCTKNCSRDQAACLEFASRRAKTRDINREVHSTALHFLVALNFTAPMGEYLENLARWLQLKIMQQPQGMERIEEGALYFHPQDCREKVLGQYKQKLATLSSSVN